MELKLVNGDYVPDNMGGFMKVSGTEEKIQRILYKLQGRRGGFSPMPDLGSRLCELINEKKSNREAAAEQYINEALVNEDVTVNDVSVYESDGGLIVNVRMTYNGESAEFNLNVGGGE